MAIASPNITTIIVELNEFPDLVRRYRISGVPLTVVNDTIQIEGARPEALFVQQALAAFQPRPSEDSPAGIAAV